MCARMERAAWIIVCACDVPMSHAAHSQDAVALIRDIADDPEKAAKRLAEEAYNRGSCDNISCVVIRLKY